VYDSKPLSLLNNHLVSSSNKNGNSFTILAILNYQHSFVGGSEGDFSNFSGASKLLCADFFKSWNNSGPSGHSEKLDVSSSYPSNSREVILKQQVVGLIIESPLAHDNSSSGIFY
jgi:hypothetical protein